MQENTDQKNSEYVHFSRSGMKLNNIALSLANQNVDIFRS